MVVEFGVAAAELVTVTVAVLLEEKSAFLEYSMEYEVRAGDWPVRASQDKVALSGSESESNNLCEAAKFATELGGE